MFTHISEIDVMYILREHCSSFSILTTAIAIVISHMYIIQKRMSSFQYGSLLDNTHDYLHYT